MYVVGYSECKTGSDKGSSYLSSSCSTPPPVLPRACVEPISEQEISVYRKLCQDLENLVQLTKGIDAVPAPSEPPPPAPQKENATSSSSSEDDEKPEAEQETSPINYEISTILENLRSLGERTGSSTSCSKEELKVEASKPIVADDKGFGKMTKDTCDPAAREAAAPANESKSKKIIGKEEEEEDEEEEEEEEEELEEKERKDRLLDDNVFFRKVQLAKLSGDWKESTPNSNAVNQRRSSLADTDNSSHWEGEIRSSSEPQRVSMVCNASSPDMSRLTAKYVCYITNHITTQLCLLLVFFLALLLAIVTVP